MQVDQFTGGRFSAHRKFAYSYGDSAGISPDFPFHPFLSGTKIGTKIAELGNFKNVFVNRRVQNYFESGITSRKRLLIHPK